MFEWQPGQTPFDSFEAYTVPHSEQAFNSDTLIMIILRTCLNLSVLFILKRVQNLEKKKSIKQFLIAWMWKSTIVKWFYHTQQKLPKPRRNLKDLIHVLENKVTKK